MLSRYSGPRMTAIWSDLQRFKNWVRVEAESLRAQVQLGLINVEVPDDLEQTISIDPDVIDFLENTGTPEQPPTRHDVVAFLLHTSPQLPEHLRPYWHRKMTSYDPQDTGLSLQLVESLNVIREDVEALMAVIKERAHEFKYTPMIGRTHAVHAEPITFGVKLANWYDEFQRHLDRIESMFERLAVGKISGAVGMYTLPPMVEAIVCERLGLNPVIAAQVISRDIITEYVSLLGNICGTLGKIGISGRLMQQTEVREVQEAFGIGQKGSSAMPHKRNPTGQENVSGLIRIVQAFVNVAYRNQETWHERDISNSGAERIILPDSSGLTDYLLVRLTRIIKGWKVSPERMLDNLNLTRGLVFSQQVQALVAAKSGLPREEAYALVYDIAQRCWETGADFHQALMVRDEIGKTVNRDELDACFKLDGHLEHVDHIFNTVFPLPRKMPA